MIIMPHITIYVGLGALNHPPRPIYETEHLLIRLELTVDSITTAEPRALIILGGDLNQIDVDDVIERTGLLPLIEQPTRAKTS